MVLPTALPGIIAAAIFSMIVSWNDYLFGRVFLNSLDNLTLTVGVMLFFEGTHVDWGLLMAASRAHDGADGHPVHGLAAPSGRRLRRRRRQRLITETAAMDVSLERINKSFGAVQVLKDIDLVFPSRKFVTLLGPSGCGKTTLLRMIAGLEPVTSGVIRFGDRVVNELAPRDRNIAMVFQSYALYPQMTVRRNLGYGLRVRRRPKPRSTRRWSASPASWRSAICSTASRRSSPAASASAWRWAAPWCASPTSS